MLESNIIVLNLYKFLNSENYNIFNSRESIFKELRTFKDFFFFFAQLGVVGFY